MKNISVSQKIKILGALLIISIFAVIAVTIYLNQKNIKDATIVNIAGKQRMLTQRITKNIFYLYQVKSNDFTEIDNAISEFNYGLVTLKDGNELLKISRAPRGEITEQISKVTVLWHSFEKNTKDFKKALLSNDVQKLNSILKFVYATNNNLLEEVDNVVTLYAMHIEKKTDNIKKFQYLSFSLMFLLGLYSVIQLRQIEAHAREFLEKSKKMISSDIGDIEPLDVNAEKEFHEVADTLNSFVNRVNSAMNYSETALEQSKMASDKLENLTEEFANIIDELENKSDVVKELDKSEDIAIESTDNLLKTTKKLQALKSQLDLLLQSANSTKEK